MFWNLLPKKDRDSLIFNAHIPKWVKGLKRLNLALVTVFYFSGWKV